MSDKDDETFAEQLNLPIFRVFTFGLAVITPGIVAVSLSFIHLIFYAIHLYFGVHFFPSFLGWLSILPDFTTWLQEWLRSQDWSWWYSSMVPWLGAFLLFQPLLTKLDFTKDKWIMGSILVVLYIAVAIIVGLWALIVIVGTLYAVIGLTFKFFAWLGDVLTP